MQLIDNRLTARSIDPNTNMYSIVHLHRRKTNKPCTLQIASIFHGIKFHKSLHLQNTERGDNAVQQT